MVAKIAAMALYRDAVASLVYEDKCGSDADRLKLAVQRERATAIELLKILLDRDPTEEEITGILDH